METIALAASEPGGGGGSVTWRRIDGTRTPVLEAQERLRRYQAIEGPALLAFRARIGATFPPGAAGRAVFQIRLHSPGRPETRLAHRELTAATPTDVLEGGQVAVPEGRSVLQLDALPANGGSVSLADPIVELTRDRAAQPRERKNLLIVTADTTRADALAPWGGPSAPALERLARDGIVFDNAHSVAFGTTPSHASLFTGQAAARHGVYDNATRLGRGVTLAERLRDDGYQTAAFVSAAPLARELGLDRGFLVYDDLFAPDAESGLGEFAHHERRADVTAARFEAWLRRRPRETPFFAWLHFYDPHQPYAPPEPVADPEDPADREFGVAGDPRYVVAEETPPDRLAAVDAAARRRYQAEIAFLDRQLGRVLDRLRGEGLYDDAVVVFVSDHGENFLDRGSAMAFHHGGLFPEVTRLGLVVKLPGAEGAGGRRPGVVANSDLACLAARALGTPPASGWSCRGVLAALRSGHPLRRRTLVLEGAARGEIAVRSQGWLLRSAGPEIADADLAAYGFEAGRVQLYDLAVDPDSRRDLVAAEAAPPGELARLERLVAAVREVRADPGEPVRSDAHREALRALGYLP